MCVGFLGSAITRTHTQKMSLPPIALGEPNYFETNDAAPITCLDTCRSKPLILTGSSNGTVCVFDHQAKCKLLAKSLEGALTTVTIHPSGLAAAYGVDDRVVLAHILDDDLRPFLEFSVTQLSQLSFSHGGNVLAVAHGDTISLYDFTKAVKICEVGGSKGSRFVKMAWGDCGETLYTIDESSHLTRWSVDLCGAKCTLECSQSLVDSSAPAVVEVASIALPTKDKVCVLRDSTLHILSAASLEHIDTLSKAGGEQFTAMAASGVESGLVFLGVDKPGDGDESIHHALRVVSAFGDAKDHRDMPMSGSLSHLHMADSESLLCAAGALSGLSTYPVADRRRVDSSAHDNSQGPTAQVANREALLISEKQFDELTNAVANLEHNIRDAELDHQFNIRRKETAIIDDMEKAKSAYHEDAENRAERLHSVETDVIATRLRIEREQREIALRHADERGRLENETKGKLSEHVRVSKATEAAVSEEMRRIEQEQRLMAMEHQDRVESVRNGLEGKLWAKNEARIDLEERVAALKKELIVSQAVIEEELDAGVESVKRQYREKLAAERDASLQLMSSNGILRKKIASAMSRIESNKDAAIKNQLTREDDLKRKQALLEEQAAGHDKEYRDKASALDAKDEVLADLRDKQRGLNETIAVLEDRSNNIKAQIDKRRKEAANIDLQSEVLSTNIENIDKKADKLGSIVDEMQAKVIEKSKGSTRLCRRTTKQDAYIQSLLRGLDGCRTLVQRPSELADAVAALECKLSVSKSSSETSPREERIDEQEDSDDALEETINKLEQELSDLLRQQAIAEKRFKGQRDAVQQVNEKLLEKTSVPLGK